MNYKYVDGHFPPVTRTLQVYLLLKQMYQLRIVLAVKKKRNPVMTDSFLIFSHEGSLDINSAGLTKHHISLYSLFYCLQHAALCLLLSRQIFKLQEWYLYFEKEETPGHWLSPTIGFLRSPPQNFFFHANNLSSALLPISS